MSDYNSEFDTLFLPVKGKIYTSRKFPHILYDAKAIEVSDRIPEKVTCSSVMVQYTYLSGAIRAKKIDGKVDDFLYLNPNGVVVELCSRMSTACYRLNTTNKWYCVDSARNISIRERLFGPKDNVTNIKGNIFSNTWLKQVLEDNPNCPILIVCIGVFNYYERSRVFDLLNRFYQYNNLEVIFDAVSSKGMQRMAKFYKQMGMLDYKDYFYLDSKEDLNVGFNNTVVLDDQPFFTNIPKRGIKLATRIYMKLADMLRLINIYHISTRE